MYVTNHRRDKRTARGPKGGRGQSLLEFALALPALLILFLGLIELALALRAQLVLTNANREAARYASHGAYTDEQVVARTMAAFSEQLPASLSGSDANTGIIITHFHVPPGDADATWDTPITVTGTLTYTNRSGQVIPTPSKLADETGDLTPYAQKLEKQERDFLTTEENGEFLTTNDIVIVETYYHHRQVLNAPLISNWIPEPIVLYMRTAMRVSRPRVEN